MKIGYVDKDAEKTGKVKEVCDRLDELIEEKRTEAAESKEYQAMMAKYKKSLGKIYRDGCGCPSEWSYGLDYLVEFLRFMRDYYALGINVWAMERKDEDPKKYKNCPTRVESLTKTIEYYDKWQSIDTDDEYVKVIHHPETYKSHENGDGTVTVDNLGYHCEYKYGSAKKTYKKMHQEEQKYKRLFFESLCEHLEDWWD